MRSRGYAIWCSCEQILGPYRERTAAGLLRMRALLRSLLLRRHKRQPCDHAMPPAPCNPP